MSKEIEVGKGDIIMVGGIKYLVASIDSEAKLGQNCAVIELQQYIPEPSLFESRRTVNIHMPGGQQ